jgi:ArsR family transcriptional regulator
MTVDRIAQIAKALAHPARLRILGQFRVCRPHIVQEIVGECELAQSTISEHLRILREANLLFATKDGPRTWYCLRRSVLDEFSRAVVRLEERQPANAG